MFVRLFLIEIKLLLHICRKCAVELCTRKGLSVLNLVMLLREFSQLLKLTFVWQLAIYGLNERSSWIFFK